MLSKNENDVMSSLSILSAFSILMNGAKGETQKDLMRFLKYSNSLQLSEGQTVNEGMKLITGKYQDQVKDESKKDDFEDYMRQFRHQLIMANRIIINKDTELLSEFTNVVNDYFRAETQRADFKNNAIEETNKINDWVLNKTNNKIQKIFNKLEEDTTAVILNVLYFKGQWEKEFSEGLTQKRDFYNNGVTAVKTDTMTNEDPYRYGESSELDAQLLEMDYMGGDISFVVVLPKQRNGLNSMKDRINAQNLERALKNMTTQNTKVYLPKFKAEKTYDLMKDINPKPIALTDKADLTGMTPQETVISKAVHKVFIEVNEKGTEAAAVTALVPVPMSAWIFPETKEFKADHPFLYFIRDKSNSMILFSGQINQF